jgi:site-specific recombinase XerC
MPSNPAADVERHLVRRSDDIEVFSPGEVLALAPAATDQRDATIYLTAAFTGLRMGELRALRWRDVDLPRSVIRVRASYAAGEFSVSKAGKVRSVPMVADGAWQLAAYSDKSSFVGEDDLVFAEPDGTWLNDDRLRRRPRSPRASASVVLTTPASTSWRLPRATFQPRTRGLVSAREE